jgi:transposase InsO family protein
VARGADALPQRQRLGIYLRGVKSVVAGQGAAAIPVAPGRPWENGYIESFNGRFRDEFLEAEKFESVPDAKEKGEWFRREYNTVRPHGSLG